MIPELPHVAINAHAYAALALFGLRFETLSAAALGPLVRLQALLFPSGITVCGERAASRFRKPHRVTVDRVTCLLLTQIVVADQVAVTNAFPLTALLARAAITVAVSPSGPLAKQRT